jgi:hypothetical protein
MCLLAICIRSVKAFVSFSNTTMFDIVALLFAAVHKCFESSVYRPLPWCPARHYLPNAEGKATLFSNPSYKIAPSKIQGAGRGLFAARRIPRRSFVVNYHGYILTEAEFMWIESRGYKLNTGIQLDFVLGGKNEKDKLTCVGMPGWPGSVVNHSDTPNCGFYIYTEKCSSNGFNSGFLVVETLDKAIEIGEEFLVDYGKMADAIIAI